MKKRNRNLTTEITENTEAASLQEIFLRAKARLGVLGDLGGLFIPEDDGRSI